MIPVLPKSQTFIQLRLLVIISTSLVHKHSKYKEEILEMAEFICYLSYISPIFFNALQFQIHSSFIVCWIYLLIILQQNICYIAYSRDLCIGCINNKLFFLALSSSTLAIKMASCMVITLVWHILCFNICNWYSFLLIHPQKTLKGYLWVASLCAILQFIALLQSQKHLTKYVITWNFG